MCCDVVKKQIPPFGRNDFSFACEIWKAKGGFTALSPYHPYISSFHHFDSREKSKNAIDQQTVLNRLPQHLAIKHTNI